MESSKKSYTQILKSTTLLGGVQAVNLFVGVFRTKIAALLIGVEGLGLVALFNSIIDLLRPIFNLGLNTSAVKDISHTASNHSSDQLNKTVQAAFLLLILMGGVGAAFLLLFADLFCIKTFQSLEYLLEVRCLSLLLITTAVLNGYFILFQGIRKLGLLALCNAGSALMGLLIMVPFYYFMGMDGVVPYLIVSSIVSVLFVAIVGRKFKPFSRPLISLKELWDNGGMMIRLGALLTVNSLFGAVVQYYLRQHLLEVGGLEVVGLFAASISILEGYGGIIFTSMSGDFFPRLSGIHSNRKEMKELLGFQIEVGVLLSSLFIIFLIAFSPLAIPILLSSEFLILVPMIMWGAIALVIKAIYIPLDYVLIAKNNRRAIVIMEILSMIYLAFGIILGYRWGGMAGMGIGYLITALLNWAQIQLFLDVKYQIKLPRSLYLLIVTELSLFVFLLVLVLCLGHNWIVYVVGGLAFAVQLCFSCRTFLNNSDSFFNRLIARWQKRR